jgi:hypothetical protein
VIIWIGDNLANVVLAIDTFKKRTTDGRFGKIVLGGKYQPSHEY